MLKISLLKEEFAEAREKNLLQKEISKEVGREGGREERKKGKKKEACHIGDTTNIKNKVTSL